MIQQDKTLFWNWKMCNIKEILKYKEPFLQDNEYDNKKKDW